VLYDAEGKPVRAWERVWDLYADWLDALTGDRRSFMIVDSKTIARFMATYRRSHVITAHVVHGSHRDATGALKESRRAALTRTPGFDLVVVLSVAQAGDLARDIGSGARIAVIPNGRGEGPRSRSTGARSPGRGVVIASLTRRKRVSHAVSAVQQVNARTGVAVTLDVYGDGESRASLERRTADDARITLHGHVPEVRTTLDSASFSLFTAHSEGFPLALVEAMEAGCIPLAYDIDYGPAEIIRDGRNGFLIPPGDIEGLAAAIEALARMPDRQLERMRKSATRAVRRFTDEDVCVLWAEALRLAVLRRSLRSRPRLLAVARKARPLVAVAEAGLRLTPVLRRATAIGRRPRPRV
jgi:poly(glycerol-phosphate) alpha-glucosyltransferase